MIGRRIAVCCAVAVIIGGVAPARADVLYEQPVFAWNDYALGFVPSDFSLEYGIPALQVLDGFVLESAASLQDLHWWGVGGNEAADQFTVRLFTGDLNSLSLLAEFTPPSVNRAATDWLVPLPGDLSLDVWSYAFDLDQPLPLDGAVPYYLSIVNNTPDSETTDWAWVFGTGGNNEFAFRLDDTQGWTQVPVLDMAYQLTGTVVPEPATLTLLGLGITGFLLQQRRRPKRV